MVVEDSWWGQCITIHAWTVSCWSSALLGLRGLSLGVCCDEVFAVFASVSPVGPEHSGPPIQMPRPQFHPVQHDNILVLLDPQAFVAS
jgi:hypothetical protein